MHRVLAPALKSICRRKQPIAAPASEREVPAGRERAAPKTAGFSGFSATASSGGASRPRARYQLVRSGLILAAATAGISLTGCQVDIGGQTLPSGYYLQDDIQYFPAGPEFKLSKEAAAQKEFRDEQAVDDPHCSTCR